MQENFDKGLQGRFKAVLINMNDKKNGIKQSAHSYGLFPSIKAVAKKKQIVDDCLSALNNYSVETIELAKKHPQNKAVYEAHYTEFVEMLEYLEKTDPLDLKNYQYTLSAPKDLPYEKTFLEIFNPALVGVMVGLSIGLITYGVILVSLTLWATLSVTFPPALIGTGVLLFYVMPFVAAGAGAVLGAFIGALTGYFEGSPYENDTDVTNNPTLALLKEACDVLGEVVIVDEEKVKVEGHSLNQGFEA